MLHRVAGDTSTSSWSLYSTTRPETGFSSESIRRMSVLFPAPVSPTMAVLDSGGKSCVSERMMVRVPSG